MTLCLWSIEIDRAQYNGSDGRVLQGSHMLEKYLNLEGLKIKSALKSTGKSLKSLEKSFNSSIFCRT